MTDDPQHYWVLSIDNQCVLQAETKQAAVEAARITFLVWLKEGRIDWNIEEETI